MNKKAQIWQKNCT